MKESLLFDTTIWIDFLNGIDSEKTKLLEEYIANDYPVLTCPTIIQEVLQGIKNDDQFKEVKSSLLAFKCLFVPPIDAAIGAANLFRNLRKKGITIRKSNDSLIAWHAIHFKIKLVHNDSDFDLITKESKLSVFN
jgi:predicted nucleic acid-binding protein